MTTKGHIDYMNPSAAERLRNLLRRAGLSERDAARELEVDERALDGWCAGVEEPPRVVPLALEGLARIPWEVRATGGGANASIGG